MTYQPDIQPLNPGRNPNWEAIAARIPRVTAYCYVCDAEFETYQGVLTVPPDPSSIHTRHELLPVATCGAAYCERVEGKRQQAVFSLLPEIEWARESFYMTHAKPKGTQQTTSPALPPPEPTSWVPDN